MTWAVIQITEWPHQNQRDGVKAQLSCITTLAMIEVDSPPTATCWHVRERGRWARRRLVRRQRVDLLWPARAWLMRWRRQLGASTSSMAQAYRTKVESRHQYPDFSKLICPTSRQLGTMWSTSTTATLPLSTTITILILNRASGRR